MGGTISCGRFKKVIYSGTKNDGFGAKWMNV